MMEAQGKRMRRALCVMKMGARRTTLFIIHDLGEEKGESEIGSPTLMSAGKISGNYDGSSWEDEGGILCDEDGS